MALFCFIFGMCLGAFLMAPMSYLGTKVRGKLQKQEQARIKKAALPVEIVQTVQSETVQPVEAEPKQATAETQSE